MNKSNVNDKFYTEITPSVLESLGGSISPLGLSIFDSIEQGADGFTPDIEFVNTPMKLRADIIMICLEGSLAFILDSNRPVNLGSGDISLFKEGQIVEFVDADFGSKLITLSIPRDIAVRSFKDWDIFADAIVVRPPADTLDDICTVYRLMKAKMNDPASIRREEIIYSYMNVMMLNIYDAMIETGVDGLHENMASAGNRQITLYNRFIREVKRCFTTHRDVAYYASALLLSPGHLSRIVKNISGKTVSDWIKDYVILEAKVMLRSKELAVYQISDMLNFPNPSFFSKYFRAREGLTPTQYRNKYR